MRFENAYIPFDAAWSSPFVRWQGPAADVSSLELAEKVTARALRERSIDAESIEELVLGFTVPQKQSFYGAPTDADALRRLADAGVARAVLPLPSATSDVVLPLLDRAAPLVTAVR